MANGKITLGKQSGGQLALVIPDGVSNTEVIIPESGELVNKDYADLKVALTAFIGTNVSLANSGYQKLPSGLIIQWGIASTSTAGATTSFPITFPNAHMGTSAVAVGGAGSSVVISAVNSTKSNITFTSSTGSPSVRYIVIGY